MGKYLNFWKEAVYRVFFYLLNTLLNNKNRENSQAEGCTTAFLLACLFQNSPFLILCISHQSDYSHHSQSEFSIEKLCWFAEAMQKKAVWEKIPVQASEILPHKAQLLDLLQKWLQSQLQKRLEMVLVPASACVNSSSSSSSDALQAGAVDPPL